VSKRNFFERHCISTYTGISTQEGKKDDGKTVV